MPCEPVTNVTQMTSKAMLSSAEARCYRDCVRRTVDLALDTEQMIRHRMATRGISFEQAVNDSIRQGFDRGSVWEPFRAEAASVRERQMSPGCATTATAERSDQEALRNA